MKIPNFNTMADAIDRLIVTVNKLAFFENKKREESLKPSPDTELLAHWDRLSRNECEYRNLLKREIDNILEEIVYSGKYQVLPDNRTFAAPPKSVGDLLAESIPAAWKDEVARAFEENLQKVGRGCRYGEGQ